jgi:hypothetical protein
MALFAKKKAKKTPAAAALEQLEKLEADLPDPIGNGTPVGVATAVDEPLSKKEQMALEKQRKKEAKAAKKAAEQAQKAAEAESQKAQRAAALAALESGEDIPDPFAVGESGLSKKEQMALDKKAEKAAKKAAAAEAREQSQAAPDGGGKKDPRAAALKALEEMERAEAAQLEAQAASAEYDEFAPAPKEEDVLAGMDLSGMSKKEIKKLRQQEEKKRDKMAAKAAKKAARKAEAEAADDDTFVAGGAPGEGLESSDMDGNAAVEDIDVSIFNLWSLVEKDQSGDLCWYFI